MHRGNINDPPKAGALHKRQRRFNGDKTGSKIDIDNLLPALDWLSLLANTAEDVHLERRRRHHRDGDSPRAGSLDAVLERVAEAGISADDLVTAVATLQVSPVITAHPTEVRRKTVLEVLAELSDLLDELDLRRGDPASVTRVESELSVRVLLLWQTALLRLSKLRVRDEINEAIRYYDTSLFDIQDGLEELLMTDEQFAQQQCEQQSEEKHEAWLLRKLEQRNEQKSDDMRIARFEQENEQ